MLLPALTHCLISTPTCWHATAGPMTYYCRPSDMLQPALIHATACPQTYYSQPPFSPQTAPARPSQDSSAAPGSLALGAQCGVGTYSANPQLQVSMTTRQTRIMMEYCDRGSQQVGGAVTNHQTWIMMECCERGSLQVGGGAVTNHQTWIIGVCMHVGVQAWGGLTTGVRGGAWLVGRGRLTAPPTPPSSHSPHTPHTTARQPLRPMPPG